VAKPSFEDYLKQCVGELGFGDDSSKADSMYRINLTAATSAAASSAALALIINTIKSMRKDYHPSEDETLLFYREDPTTDFNLVLSHLEV
jgi:hypothetical protein